MFSSCSLAFEAPGHRGNSVFTIFSEDLGLISSGANPPAQMGRGALDRGVIGSTLLSSCWWTEMEIWHLFTNDSKR